MGFTADRDILDGDIGVARLLGLENGDPERMLDGLGSWDLATRGLDDPAARVLRRRALEHGRAAADPAPTGRSRPRRSRRSRSRSPSSSPTWCRYHDPRTGLEAKYSLEYDLATIALDGRAGVAPVHRRRRSQRPEAAGAHAAGHAPSRRRPGPCRAASSLTLANGEQLEESVEPGPRQPRRSAHRGGDRRRSSTSAPAPARRRGAARLGSIDLCGRLESLGRRARARGRDRGDRSMTDRTRRSRMTYDLVVKDGRIVDGTGAPAYGGDVAITGRAHRRRSARSTRRRRRARSTPTARSSRPGFIDAHTHYDAQLLWDPTANPSTAHGITTILTGQLRLHARARARPRTRTT